jgi:hypothetical protein
MIFFINESVKINDNFKKWFGNSKIVEGGSPEVCYHGSKNNIKDFKTEYIGSGSGNLGHYGYGIYFSYSESEAKGYGDKIYKCYLRVENPFTATKEQLFKLSKTGVGRFDAIVDKTIKFDSLIVNFKDDDNHYNFLSVFKKYGYEDGYQKAWEYLRSNNINSDGDFYNDISSLVEYSDLNEDAYEIDDYVYDLIKQYKLKVVFNKDFEYEQSLHWITNLGGDSKEVTEIIKKMGYDGIIYGSEIVLFNPNQIKSINNDGSWDLNDNNIYS